MELPKLMKFSFKFKNGNTVGLTDSAPEEEVTVLEGVSQQDLAAWLAQAVACPRCEGAKTVAVNIGGEPERDPCELCNDPESGPTGHMTLGALILKLEAK